MIQNKERTSGLWYWIVIGFIVAAIALGVLIYIGWFNNNTHVDSVNGSNVEHQYEIEEANADAPGEASWQNAGHQTLKESIVVPDSETETPPESE